MPIKTIIDNEEKALPVKFGSERNGGPQWQTVPIGFAVGLVLILLAMLGWFAIKINDSLAAHEKMASHEGTKAQLEGLKEANEATLTAVSARLEGLQESVDTLIKMHLQNK